MNICAAGTERDYGRIFHLLSSTFNPDLCLLLREKAILNFSVVVVVVSNLSFGRSSAVTLTMQDNPTASRLTPDITLP